MVAPYRPGMRHEPCCWALLRWRQPGRVAATVGLDRVSELSCEFVGRDCDGEPGKGIDTDFVVPASQALHERVASDDRARGPVGM